MSNDRNTPTLSSFDVPHAHRITMPRHDEANQLVSIGASFWGGPAHLAPPAAAAWQEMWGDAAKDGINLVIVSAFRSIKEQAALVQTFVERGMAMEDVVRHVAMPGFSEHHTGLAIDIGAVGRLDPVEQFASTVQFSWLMANASRFSFHMTYPENNEFGMTYEPWHWRFSSRD
jgi:D-alanyl-D-alanine carboxypeptidase